MRKLLFLSLLLVTLLFSGCANYDLVKDQSYDKTNVPYGVFDAYYPKGPLFGLLPDKGVHPVVIAIHGGAWEGGDKQEMHNIADDLCPLGYIVISPNYSLSTKQNVGGVDYPGRTWPNQINDLQNAVAYFKAHHLDLKIDPTKMSSLGISAGGHLASMLAVRPDTHNPGNAPALQNAIDLDGEQDMTLPGAECMSEFDDILSFVSGNRSTDWSDPSKRTPDMSTLCKDISTLTWIPTANPKPAFLIIHGQGDTNVFVKNADLLEKALLDAKCDVRKVVITGSDGVCHGRCWEVPKADEAMHKFLEDHLKR